MNIEIEIKTDFYEQIIKMIISSQIIKIVIIEKTLIHKVKNANIVNSPGINGRIVGN